MKLLVKIFLISIVLLSWSSFAIKDNYNSILKKEINPVKTFAEFQSDIKKDFLEIRRELAGQEVLVLNKGSKDQKILKKVNSSSI